jgi:hypothetical protein
MPMTAYFGFYPISENHADIVTSTLVPYRELCLPSDMQHTFENKISWLVVASAILFSFSIAARAAVKVHMVSLGKPTSVPWSEENNSGAPTGANQKPSLLKIRPLIVDTRIREFTVGPAHDVTDRLFVVRRAFRVNDSLPQEVNSPPHWIWQRGGWLLIDRLTGRISPISLPEFDPIFSAAGWYRDYAAFCGVSDDGKKIYAVVAQLNRRKPVIKKIIEGSGVTEGDEGISADSLCPVPEWQRSPTRVSFDPPGAAKQTYAIRGHVVDLVTEEEDEEAEK